MTDTTDAQKIAVLRDEVLNLRERNEALNRQLAFAVDQEVRMSARNAYLADQNALLEQDLTVAVRTAQSRGRYIDNQMYQSPLEAARTSTPSQENALALLRLPHNAAGLPYRGSVFPATWDNLHRRGLVVIDWTITGARPDGIVTLAPEQTP